MISLTASPVARIAAVASALILASSLVACGGGGGDTGAGAGTTTTTVAGTGGSAGNPYDTADKINNYLDGKTLTMSAADIPTDPNGINEDLNAGQATQCYESVVMKPTAAAWHVTSTLGTLNNAPNKGDKGTCDNTTAGMMVSFDSTAILVANVTATCFDFTATYVGFSQEGRGDISADGKTLKLELYFGGTAAGHRCADGAVGAPTVKIQGAAFTGNAVQTYQVQ